MTILQHSIAQAAAAATGYQISRSLRFNSADSAYLSRTPASNGNRQIWTFSGWIKRAALGSVQNIIRATDGASNDTLLRFESSDKIGVYTNATSNLNLQTAAVYRDTAAHFHVLLAVDTTQATASNRAKLYVNGVQVTAFSTETYPTQNANTQFNSTSFAMNIGRYSSGAGSEYLSAYLSDIYFIDGQALTPSSFGETDATTGVWVPKAYTGTYGTNGFWLKFDDNSGTTSTTLGKDSSGNGNNWTPNNFSVTAGVGNDSLVDSPTWYGTDTGAGGEVRGNYATLNPLYRNYSTTNGSSSNGNLDASFDVGSAFVVGTMDLGSGSWYAEVTLTSVPQLVDVGIYAPIATGTEYVATYLSDARKSVDGSTTSYGATYTANDVIGIAVNASTKTVTFYKNNVSQGSMTWAGTYSTLYIGCSARATNSGTRTASFNFGQRPFAYTAPSGFKALCTTNLPTPAIGASASTLASKNFNVLTYTGDGASSRTLTGVGFQPDFVWAKNRSTGAVDHSLYDVIRGAGNDKELISNSTAAEGGGNHESYGWLSAFTADGFTTTKGAGVNYYFNENSATYVAWNWKAGGTAVSNTAGSITSQVSANTAAGVSVVTYTGNATNSTVGHGLGKAPSMIIFKDRTAARTGDQWPVYHASIGATKQLYLNQTIASGTSSTVFNDTAPTSSVFSVGTWGGINYNGDAFVAYCFAEVPGFSKFGSYTGNGSADGPFVYCGFRPRYILIKGYALAGAYWIIIDTARDTYNVAVNKLGPNVSDAENSANLGNTTQNIVDVLSNGFKLRSTTGDTNNGSQSYVFAAFAEAPFQYSRAR